MKKKVKHFTAAIMIFVLISQSITFAPVYSHFEDVDTQVGILTVKVKKITFVDSERKIPYNEAQNIPYGSNVGQITPEYRKSLCLSTATTSSDSGPMVWDEKNQKCYKTGSSLDDGLNGESEILLKFRTNHQTHLDPKEVDGLARNFIGLNFPHIECVNFASAPYASVAYCGEWKVIDHIDLDQVVYSHEDCIEMEQAIVAVHGVSVGDDDLAQKIGAGLAIAGGVGLFVPGVGQLATIASLFAVSMQQKNVDFGEAGATFTKDDLGTKIVQTNGNNQKLLVELEGTYEKSNNRSCGSTNETSGLHSNGEHSSIPGWIKSNAAWWAQNQIDDQTFALAIGHLVKTNVIKLDSEFTTTSGELMVNENLLLPDWIKNNALWWSEGAISDSDFRQGIQYMINEKIISFSKSNKQNAPISNNSVQSSEHNTRLAKLIFETQKKNEVVMNWLLTIKNYEAKVLEKVSDEAWNYYGQNKNQKVLRVTTQLDQDAKQAQQDVQNSLSALKKIQILAEKSKKDAITAGVSESEIDQIDNQLTAEIDLIPSAFETISDLNSVKDEAQQAQQDANDSMRETLREELKEKFSTLPGLEDFTESEINQILQESVENTTYEGSYVGSADYLTGWLYNDYSFYLTAIAPDVYILIMSQDPTGKLWDLFVQTLLFAQLQSESNPRYYYAIRDYSEIVEAQPIEPVLPFVLVGPEELINSLNSQAQKGSDEGVDTESQDSTNTINTKMGKVPVYASDCPPIKGKGAPGDTVHVFINQGGVFNFKTVTKASTVVDENGDWEIILDPPCLEDGLYDIGISYEKSGSLTHEKEFPIIIDTGSGITKDYIVHTLGETLDALDAFGEEENNVFMDQDTTNFLRYILLEYGDKLDKSHKNTLELLIDAEYDYYVDPFDEDYDPTFDIPVYDSKIEYYEELERILDWLYDNFGDLPVDGFWEDQRIRVTVEQPEKVNFDSGPWLLELNDSSVWYPEAIWGHHKLLEFLEGDLEEILIDSGVALDSEGDETILNSSEDVDLSELESQNETEEQTLYVIDVSIINGNAYPSFQFVVYPAYSGCPDDYLRPAVSKYNTAYHVNFDEIGLTYEGGGCGNFGIASEVENNSEYPITESQAQYLQELFGFEDFREIPYNP